MVESQKTTKIDFRLKTLHFRLTFLLNNDQYTYIDKPVNQLNGGHE